MPYAQGTVSASALNSAIISSITTPIGETDTAGEVSVVVGGSNNAVQLTMPSLGSVHPSGWRIYRGTSSGTETLLTTVPGSLTTWYDDGSYTPTSTTVPTTGYGNIGSLPLVISNAASAAAENFWLAQSFTTTNTSQAFSYDQLVAQGFFPTYGTITAFDLPLTNVGSPSGNITLSIYGATYNQPSATTDQNFPNTQSSIAPLATVTVGVGSVANFNGTSAYTRFTLSSALTLSTNTLYYFVLRLSNSADTIASGNYVEIAGRVGSGLTSLCPAMNFFCTGGATVLTTGAWTISNTNNGLCYKLYATGTLTGATYYYKISAVTGWSVLKSFQQYYENNSNLLTATVLYSSAATGVENMYALLYQGGSDQYNQFNAGLLEYYDLNTNIALGYNSSTTYTNGTAIAGLSSYYNLQKFNFVANTNNIGGTTNVTYRVHYFLDHIYFTIMGDPTITGWQENSVWLGKATPLASTDTPYLVAQLGTTPAVGSWGLLRDFNSDVNVKASMYFPIASSQTALPNGDTTDSFNFINSYTNNNDSIRLYIGDSYGLRGYIPDLLLFPSNITSILNNHDTFTVGGVNYEFYTPNNYKLFAFGQEVVSSSETFYKIFYPAVSTQ